MKSNEQAKKFSVGQICSYILPGVPIPQMRPRFGGGRVWNSQKQQKFAAQLTLKNQHENEEALFSGPIHVDVVFYFEPKKSASQKQREKIYGTHHIFTPDIDNLTKFILDTSIGILFNDDCIVSSLTACKKYGERAETVLTITQLANK